MTASFTKGDSLELIQTLTSASIDLIYINPPFGTTQNYWDESINWTLLFPEMFRVLKPAGMLVIHCSIPFNYTLIRAAPKAPSYSWYWVKDNITCPLLANMQPLRKVEEVLVWKNKKNTYYRQQIGNEPHKAHFMTNTGYYKNAKKTGTKIINGITRTHLLEMNRDISGFSTRPKEMVELMIKTYTKENDTVLDIFCYKGMTAAVCTELKRNSISFDKYHSPVE